MPPKLPRFIWTGLARFKPFAETDDLRPSYERVRLLAVLTIVTAAASFGALALVAFGSPLALQAWLLAVALNVLTAGAEWQHGMSGRALNQLVMMAGLLGLSWLAIASQGQ